MKRLNRVLSCLVFMVLTFSVCFTSCFEGFAADESKTGNTNISSSTTSHSSLNSADSSNTDVSSSPVSDEVNDSETDKMKVFNLIGVGVEVPGISNVGVGILVWGIIIIVLIIVVFVIVKVVKVKKRRKSYTGYVGKRRYQKNPYSKKKKRILNDKYYNNKRYK